MNLYVKQCLHELNLEQPNIRTMICSAVREVQMEPARIWQSIANIKAWKLWHPEIYSAQIEDDQELRNGSRIILHLQSGWFRKKRKMTALVFSMQPKHFLGLTIEYHLSRQCYVWAQKPIDQNRTLVTGLKIIKGADGFLQKTFNHQHHQRKMQVMLDNLNSYTKQQTNQNIKRRKQ